MRRRQMDLLWEVARPEAAAYAWASLDKRASARESMIPHTSIENGRKSKPACSQASACLVILLSALAATSSPGAKRALVGHIGETMVTLI